VLILNNLVGEIEGYVYALPPLAATGVRDRVLLAEGHGCHPAKLSEVSRDG
jgi:uncharacterized membrane protein YpjA